MISHYEVCVYPKWMETDPNKWFVLKWTDQVVFTLQDVDAIIDYMSRNKKEGRSVFVFMISRERGSSGSTEFYDWHLIDNDLIQRKQTVKALYRWIYHIIEELV